MHVNELYNDVRTDCLIFADRHLTGKHSIRVSDFSLHVNFTEYLT